MNPHKHSPAQTRSSLRRLTLATMSALLCAGCSATVIYGHKDLKDGPATGSIAPLATLIPANTKTVRLVFIHGVGDHCPGYALDGEHGWLNDTEAAKIGLTPREGATASGRVRASIFTGGASTDVSAVEYQTKLFTAKLDDKRSLPVEAIEITWSHLTQWIKSTQLGYDSPSVTPPPPKPGTAPDANSDVKCIQPPSSNTPDIKHPPDRLLLDRIIKEQVFDRNLADAILYSGSYAGAMEKGVAEALCHAITRQPDTASCEWPTDTTAEKSYANIFVTHSLGSRLIYDVMLDLLRVDRPGRKNPFKPGDESQFIGTMLQRTAAFYMMANQLSLLGLAHIPENGDPTGGPEAASSGAGNKPTDILSVLTSERASLSVQSVAVAPRLEIVAFNDTNDLLTWHIPNWYAKDPGPKDAPLGPKAPQVNITNVFLRNAFPLLIIEDPSKAHSGYFKNDVVWQTIHCGGKAGSVSSC